MARRNPLTAVTLVGIVTLCSFISITGVAATKTSVASGNWGTAATWNPSGVPKKDDDVIIASGTVVTLNVNSADLGSLVIQSAGLLRGDGTGKILSVGKDGGQDVLNSGTINFADTYLAVIRIARNTQWTGSGTWLLNSINLNTKTLSFTAGSTSRLTLKGAGDPISNPGTINGIATMGVDYAGSSSQTLSSSANIKYGTLYVNNPSGVTLARNLTTTNILGDLNIQSGFLSNGSFTITGLASKSFLVQDGAEYRMTGTTGMVTGFGTKSFSAASTINYGGANQTVSQETYGHLVLSGSGTKTMPASALNLAGSLSVSGTATASAASSLDISGDFSVGAGSSYGTSSFAHTVDGNVAITGSFSCGGSTVTFSGTSNQTISNGTFCNVVVNNAAGVTLSSDATVISSGSVTLQTGDINTGAYTLTIDNPSPSALALGSNKIVGTIARAISAGSAASYQFVTANAIVTPNGVDNPSTITATVFPDQNPPNLPVTADTSVIAKRYFTISQTGAGPGFVFTMRLPYEQSEVRGNESNYTLWRYSGGIWSNMGSAAADPTNNYVEQSSLTGFSEWAIAEPSGALPIQLAYFSASVSGSGHDVELSWGTVSETNNFGFYIQQSAAEASDFSDVPNSFVAGHGTTIEPHEYSWTHGNVAPGTYYYRLKQVDLDGSIHFTESVQVVVSPLAGVSEEAPQVFSLEQNYPNPFNPSTAIRFTVQEKTFTTLEVFNVIGQVVATPFAGEATPGRYYTINFDAERIPTGSYFYRLSNGNNTSIRRMTILK